MEYYKYYGLDEPYEDETIDEEFDISGKEYVDLITTCFKYSSVVSFYITNTDFPYYDELQKFRTNAPANVENCRGFSSRNGKTEFFKVCPEIFDLMLKISDSMFKWIDGWDYTNPNDPVFHRKDGTTFMESLVDNCVVILHPRNDEKVDNIVSKRHWYKENGKVSFFPGRRKREETVDGSVSPK